MRKLIVTWMVGQLLLIGQQPVVRNLGNFTVYDLGAQVVNVKAYGAVGDGIADDRAAIVLAIAAAQANKQQLFFPGGVFCVGATGAGLQIGDGTSSLANTLPAIQVDGAGHGFFTSYDATPRNPTPTVIKWCGSAPASSTPVIEFRGPQSGGALRNLMIDTAGVDKVYAVLLTHVSYFDMTNVTLKNQSNGYALIGTTQTATSAFGGCNNSLRNVNIQNPQTGAQGAKLTGTSAGEDSCSWTVDGGDWWHDGASVNTSSLELLGADNNYFARVNFYSTVPSGGNSTRCGVKFGQWSVDAGYPTENTFVSISAHDGICGVYGTGRPNTFIDYHQGDCSTNCDPNTIAGVNGGTTPIILGNTDTRNLTGVGAVSQINPTTGALTNYWWYATDTAGTFLASAKRTANSVQYDGLENYIWQPTGDIIYQREGTNGQSYLKSFSSTNTQRTALIFERASGTVASPGAIGAGYVLGAIAASGRNSGGTQSFAHRINMVVDTVDGSAIPQESSMLFGTSTAGVFGNQWGLVGGTWKAQNSLAGMQLVPIAIGSLPTCNAGNDGKILYVNDANAPTYNATIAAGGSVKTLVMCNATNWTAH